MNADGKGKLMNRSWKTTLCGAVALGGGIAAQFFPEYPLVVKIGGALAAFGTGMGLMFARDNGVSSEDVQAVKEAKAEAKANGGVGLWCGIGLLGLMGLMFSGCAWFHPEDIKPVPVAAGQDAVVVNAERIQASSLEIYKQTTEWELHNRRVLPAEVSRAVDKVRAEFKPAWLESRLILEDYKAALGTNDASRVTELTAALSAAQSSMLRLKVDSGEAFQLVNDIATLSRLISELRARGRCLPIVSPE
jgi:hypothetical protein